MSTPLRQLLDTVLFDDAGRSAFTSDPAAFLEAHGWDALEPTELDEALAALGDHLPVDAAITLADATDGVDFDADGFAALSEVAAAIPVDTATEFVVVDGGEQAIDDAFGSGAIDDTSGAPTSDWLDDSTEPPVDDDAGSVDASGDDPIELDAATDLDDPLDAGTDLHEGDQLTLDEEPVDLDDDLPDLEI